MVSTYIANMTTIAEPMLGDGAVPIIGIPIWAWSDISGTVGVATSTYAYGAQGRASPAGWR